MAFSDCVFLCFFVLDLFFFDSNILSKSFRHPKKKWNTDHTQSFLCSFSCIDTSGPCTGSSGRNIQSPGKVVDKKPPTLQFFFFLFTGNSWKYMEKLGGFRVGDMGIPRMQYGLRYEKIGVGREGTWDREPQWKGVEDGFSGSQSALTGQVDVAPYKRRFLYNSF